MPPAAPKAAAAARACRLAATLAASSWAASLPLVSAATAAGALAAAVADPTDAWEAILAAWGGGALVASAAADCCVALALPASFRGDACSTVLPSGAPCTVAALVCCCALSFSLCASTCRVASSTTLSFSASALARQLSTWLSVGTHRRTSSRKGTWSVALAIATLAWSKHAAVAASPGFSRPALHSSSTRSPNARGSPEPSVTSSSGQALTLAMTTRRMAPCAPGSLLGQSL